MSISTFPRIDTLARYAREIEAVRSAAEACLHSQAAYFHGPEHWGRVAHHAVATARSLKVEPLVPVLFAWVHDSQREHDGLDFEHGPRAAQWVSRHRESLFAFLSDQQVDTLAMACELHSNGGVADASVQPLLACCWDADRLDLWRVGVRPDPNFMSTAWARRSEVIEQARDLLEESGERPHSRQAVSG